MAAVRVGREMILLSIPPMQRSGDLDLVVAGSPEGVIMVEAGANQLPEQDIIEAIDFGYEAVRELIQASERANSRTRVELVKKRHQK